MDQTRTSTTEWSWPSALAGAAVTATAAALLVAAPRDPSFQVISISFTSFNLQFPLLDAELVLTVHVCNPNLVPISLGPSFVSLLYDGAVLGTAKIEPGHQSARSCRVVGLRARLDSVELGDHAIRFLADVARRKMALDATVEMVGTAKVMGWTRRFKVKANYGRVEVDPVFLGAIEEKNHLRLGF